jgi:hypothetical protein
MVHPRVCKKDWMKMMRPVQTWRNRNEVCGNPVRTERAESREERRIERGVKAYARAPTRSEKPPRPVRVLNLPGDFLIGVTHVL